MIKSTIAVVTGFIVWTVLFLGYNSVISIALPASFNSDGSTDSTGILILALTFSIVFSALSGLICSKLAKEGAFKSSIILGALLLGVGLIVQLQYWDQMPLWYHLSFLGLLIPGVLFGYRLINTPVVA